MEINNFLARTFGLDGKVAVVIGGGGYLCSKMAEGLARAGAKIVILDLRPANAESKTKEIEKITSENYLSYGIDVCDKKSIEETYKKIVDSYNTVDILINGAGINDPSPFFKIETQKWNDVLSSQVTGTMLSCQIFGAHMVEMGKGSIINISSASAGPPLSKAFAYSVAKAGIKNLTMNLAREWAPYGVRVNAIRPGFFPTEWNKKNFITPQRESDILKHTPMNRYGIPDELIGCTVWLASDSASFVTGAEIAIDGGFSCMTI